MGHRLGVCLGALLLGSGCDSPEPAANVAVPAAEPPSNASAETEAPANGSSIMRPSVLEEVVKNLPPPPPPPPEPLRATIGFPEGGAKLDDEARAALDALLADQRFTSGGAITLRGHSDSEGGDAANRLTSRRRAEAVRDYLVEHDVAEDRVSVLALGEGRPVAPNVRLDGTVDEQGRRRNRRVQIEVAPPPQAAPVEPGTGPAAAVEPAAP